MTVKASLATLLLVGGVWIAGCGRDSAVQNFQDIPAGSAVEVTTNDRVVVTGRLVEVGTESVTLETAGGGRTPIARSRIASVTMTSKPDTRARATLPPSPQGSPRAGLPSGNASQPTSPASPGTPSAVSSPTPGSTAKDEARVELREVTIPAGTIIPLTLETAVASNTSQVEDPVRARTRAAVRVDGVEAIPAGSAVLGVVTEAERSARVKGRARIGVRFATLRVAGGNSYQIQTAPITREAPGTKKKDTAKIAVPAAGGAIIGAIAGGKKGAAVGGAVGGGAGTAVVLSTRGKEVSLPAGGALRARLLAPITVQVPIRRS